MTEKVLNGSSLPLSSVVRDHLCRLRGVSGGVGSDSELRVSGDRDLLDLCEAVEDEADDEDSFSSHSIRFCDLMVSDRRLA